ncbi:MAG: Zn-dependent exopeptidase M28 [Lachnospiraceae bacterium]|nr:Zn-dependent exopeptidase M28 [Lachnospiraceae bacterium]
MAKKTYERLAAISYSRTSGSPEERKALKYLAGEIKKTGFDPVIEEFTYTRKVPKEAFLAVVNDDGSETVFTVTGVIDSASTGAKGKTAGFYYLRSFDEVSLSRIRDKFVLIHDRLSPEEYDRLKKAGIAGYVTTSGTIRDTYENSDLETVRFRENLKDYGAVPAFTIRMIEAVELLKLRPEKVRFKLTLKEETVKSANLVVTVEGSDLKDEILTVGAHYDSVPFSLGSWDNGAGAVEVVSLLEYLKKHPVRRTIKAVLFGSEETGLRGSRAYTDAHPDLNEKTKAMINIDVGGSILGKELIFLAAGDETESWIRGLLKEAGYEAVTVKKLMSSDSANFNDVGIPSISLGQGAPRGGGYMHTRYDNMDLIDENVLEREAGFLKYLTQRLADSEVFPIPRFIPEQLRKEIISYFGKNLSRIASLPAAQEEKPLPFRF